MDCADIFIPLEAVFAFMVILSVTLMRVVLFPEVTSAGGVWGNLSVVGLMWEINSEGFSPISDSVGVTGMPKRKNVCLTVIYGLLLKKNSKSTSTQIPFKYLQIRSCQWFQVTWWLWGTQLTQNVFQFSLQMK